jgi:hypothetical protein
VPGAWRVFQLAVEEDGGIGEFFRREAEEDLGSPAPGQGHPGPCLFGGSGRWPGVRDEIGLVAVDVSW